MSAPALPLSGSQPQPSFANPAFGPEGAVRVRTLLIIRSVAIAGQIAALLVVSLVLSFRLPAVDCAAIVFASILANLYLFLSHKTSGWLSEWSATWHLAFDIVQLSALLYLTGGLQNPFALMMLAPVTVSATILSLAATTIVGALVVVALTGLAYFHRTLPWNALGFVLPDLYMLGLWTALISSTGFIAAYVWRVSAEARSMATALAATQMALAREQKLSALGALAAAAAHELGSPLGTIAVVARELSRELPADSPLRDDIDLLQSQSIRCGEILARLAEAPDAADGDAASPFEVAPLSALIEDVVDQLDGFSGEVAIDIVQAPPERHRADEPLVARQPEILQGISNFIHNASQFARSEVTVTVAWDDRSVRVMIDDDGPGFAPAVLARLGEPYVSTRADTIERGQGHMGLGVFIASTLLARTGASVAFSNRDGANRDGGGAHVDIRWPRAVLEADPHATQDSLQAIPV